ncbi:ATP-dependent DNA helicase [Pedomonas sp. V897]|uniref:ATP-dependent DNA helicase n=1 Tax=Pedomonas sp. V897 TaxID=3446482 RepID=UPI003EE0B217
MTDQPAHTGNALLKRHPTLVAAHVGIWMAEGDGPPQPLTRGQAIRLAADTPVILLNAPLTASRLGYPSLSGLDLLELFAFVRPARFCVPTARGLARALGLDAPVTPEEEALFLRQAAEALLAEMEDPHWRYKTGAYGAAQALLRLKWPWAPLVAQRLPSPRHADRPLFLALPEWEEAPPPPRPREVRLGTEEVAERLARLVGRGAEERPQQRDYAEAASFAFRPREMQAAPNVALVEAGTGTGKTLGYLAPASLWAERSGGSVWVSTYTKALQRQLDAELARLYPDPAERARKTVVRKGRENYLCLLNLEDAVQGAFTGRAAILAHLTMRWARYTRDGDMIGGDFPGWLASLFGANRVAALTDRRGECVYAGCPHYRRCFIERAARKTAGADIVIANHALVMVNAARGRSENERLTRIVFDEGHHLFDAADSTFAAHLTGTEGLELRRWLLGPEKSRARGRRRGLEARLSELVLHDDESARLLSDILERLRDLPSEGWLQRLQEGAPEGPIERLLAAVRQQVLARAEEKDAGYGIETEIAHLLPAVVEAGVEAQAALDALATPMAKLEARLMELVEERPEWLDSALRTRIEGAANGLRLRRQTLMAWIGLLARLGGAADPEFVDWMALDRVEGREFDVGLHRHWLDPTKPFAGLVLEPAHGVVVTSATLRDKTLDKGEAALETDWRIAEQRTGAQHLALPPRRFSTPSPFNYADAARVFIVTDVKRGDIGQLAGAYKALIQAAGGGVLGLFTAIARLKAVHARIAAPLAERGLPLLAQHVDPIDTGTLVDMFRADPVASLLGTDALRDGVDVPGHSLRLVALEGVPWPRPTILHAARRAAFGGAAYDDLVTRARLAQAFGRLIRRADDRGVFVLLGAAVPSRLLSAFPPEVPVRRCTLLEAVEESYKFLGGRPPQGAAESGLAGDLPGADADLTMRRIGNSGEQTP